MKYCKNDYYANLLIKHRSNIKQILKILNTITKGDKNEHSTPAEFLICKGNEINKKEVANELNNFFVNIGHELAGNIHSNNNATVIRFLGSRNDKSFFFSYICEEEVLDVIDHLSNKASTGCDNISMVLVKNVLNQLLNLSHIFVINLLNLAYFLIT